MSERVILGIETSCDETAAAVIRGGREVLSSVVASQEAVHARFGGIVPEIASRKHAEAITAVVDEALREADAGWDNIDGIAVTHGPGLVGSLLVGVSAAKGYALAGGLPLAGINHLEGHLLANFLQWRDTEPIEPQFPLVCLVASGGHSDILLMTDFGEYKILGWTRDDAAGEALDKGARVLGLPYPGGPALDATAKAGNPSAIAFPRPTISGSFDFSFSGLKTALVRQIEAQGPPRDEKGLADFAASYQEAVVDTLVRNTTAAAKRYRARQMLLAGGVAANSRLRAKIAEAGRKLNLPTHYPPLSLCTDNAAMIAAAGHYRLERRGPDPLDIDVFSSMPVAEHV
jgi:N6-L-threonylcarbamoyladenine synthase